MRREQRSLGVEKKIMGKNSLIPPPTHTQSSKKKVLERILVVGPLPFGKGVFITDAGHQVLEACDPGAGLLRVGGDEVQGLHVVPMVDSKAAAGVKAPLSLSVEYFRLPAFGDFVNGVNKDCEESRIHGR